WIDQGLLSAYRTPGGHRRIRREDLLSFLRKQGIPIPPILSESTFKILIADDDESTVELIKTLLLRQDIYEVTSAANGIAALIEVGRIKPDLLILDIEIPGVDGIEVCRRIKSDSANKTIIIAMSGSPEYQTRSLQAGADVFMRKPFDLQKLHAEIKRILGA